MNNLIRQTHRWLGVVFTLTIIAYIVAMTVKPNQMPPPWITYAPLPPLALMWLSGTYLFVLPYAAKRRAARHTEI